MLITLIQNTLCYYSDERPELEENGIDQLIQNKDFLTYILSIAVQKLGQVASKGTCEGETQSKEKLLKVCFNIGRCVTLTFVFLETVVLFLKNYM